jgi:hypothetical protein
VSNIFFRRHFLKVGFGFIAGVGSASLFRKSSTVLAQPPFGTSPPRSQEEVAMASFRFRADKAKEFGFIGGYPNFYEATRGIDKVGGTIFLKATAEWRDVPLTELGNPSINDFRVRFKGTQDYAKRNGFVGGFPNFYHADYGRGIVCGTILLKESDAEWRDVPLVELGDNLDDIGVRFRGTQNYAKRNGFVGGFPNFYHADYGNGIVCGTILLKQGVAEWQDVVIFRGPR